MLKRILAIYCMFLTGGVWLDRLPAETPSVDRDHLNSFNFEAELKDRALLDEKLLLTTEEYGRFLTLPSAASEGESAVAVHLGIGRDLENTFVTYTKADRNLWFANKYPKTNQKEVKITRTDAAIPKSTATAVAEVWKRMLYRTQAFPLGGPFENDPTEFEVSLVNHDGEAMYGRLPLERGKHTEALYQLGKMLIIYCESDSPTRPAIAKQIERDANALVADLSKTPFCRQ